MKKFVIFVAAALSLAACSNEEENLDDSPVAVRITAGVGTRADSDQWEADEIGVMVISGNAAMENLYKNVCYVTTATSTADAEFTPKDTSEPIYFKGSEEITFAAYGPYDDSAANELAGENGIIVGRTDGQSKRVYQNISDYIYATGATGSIDDPNVSFTFKHVMSRLVIKVQASSETGITDQQLKEGYYSLSGFIHAGTFNVVTGVAKADEDGTIVNDWGLGDTVVKEGTNDITFTAILYPQTLSNGLEFRATINNQDYTATLRPELSAGKSNSYTITVKKAELKISTSSVDKWTDLDNKDVSATQ